MKDLLLLLGTDPVTHARHVGDELTMQAETEVAKVERKIVGVQTKHAVREEAKAIERDVRTSR